MFLLYSLTDTHTQYTPGECEILNNKVKNKIKLTRERGAEKGERVGKVNKSRSKQLIVKKKRKEKKRKKKK